MRPVPPAPPHGTARIQSLDGLRAVSIVLVLYGHVRATVGFPATLRVVEKLGDVAELGVRVFFVISGYLITSLLVAERNRTGTVRLGTFYARRAFRIFPAYYAFLGAMGVLRLAGLVELPGTDLLLAAAYLINFYAKRVWIVGHAWSLAVEEQFYLIWPALFRRAGPETGLRIALGVVAAGPFVRAAFALVPSTHGRYLIAEAFPTVADALATGCALCLLGPRLETNERYIRWLRSPLVPWAALASAVASIYFTARMPWAGWLVFQTLSCVTIAVVVDRYTRYPDGLVGRFLNWKPVAYIGTLSYSLYLWQQVFLVYPPRVNLVPPWSRFPENLFFACAAALASHYLVERPFFRLRDRVMRPPEKRSLPG
jgi:peptidoglycan/LPS O-acetylase OafA/YrhL